MDACAGLLPIVQFIRKGVFPLIQIGIPILLIIMGSLDLGRAVLSNDDKEIKGYTGKLIKRVLAAIAIFFLVTIITVIFNMFSNTNIDNANDWAACWKEAGK